MSGLCGILLDERGISPVVGGGLLIAIVVILAAISGAIFFGLTDDKPPAPTARLDVTPTESGCGFDFVHRGGDRIRGDTLEVQGLANPNALDGETLDATDEVDVNPTRDDLTVIWHAPEDDVDHILAELDVNTNIGGGWACATGTVLTEDSGKLKVIAGNGSNDIELTNPSDVIALGPVDLDLTDDGITDVPYLTSNGEVKITNDTNGTTTIATDSDVPGGQLPTQKTRLAVGSWNGSDRSIFFADNGGDALYRVTPGNAPVEIHDPGNGADSVQSVDDVDGDGTDELIFADSSQTLRYLEPDGTVELMDSGGIGSNVGIGSGSVADFNDNGTSRVAVIDGGNDLKLVGAPASEGGTGTTKISTVDAEAAPVTIADVDGDDAMEVVYVHKTSHHIKYLDDVGGSNTINFLRDADGDRIDGSEKSGVV